MKDIEIINIDYSAKDPLYSRDEVHSLKDSPLPFIVPLETPFYSKSLIILNGGNPLTIEKDYWLEDNLFDLEEQLGKKIQCVIRLSKNAMNDFKELTVRYQKVGEVTLSRKYLLDSIETILNNPKVDWNTQVIGKPDTYPSAFHIHDIKTELNGFGDLVTLLKMRTGRQVKEGLDIHNQILALKDKYFKQLNDTYQKRWEEIFKHIEDCNVPHPMTKADIGLGNHPNYPTATIQEDMLGEEQYKLSTPLGFHQALEQSFIDTDQYIKQGTLPFSYYGSGMYLPPPISGSFEGLGTDMANAAVCLEPNGWFTALLRGYDGKVKALYFYYCKDIKNVDKEGFTFSGYQYSNSVLNNAGVIPNHCIHGSDGRVLMIGDYENSQYFISLGNGTLDPNAHQMKKVDLSAFIDPVEGNVFDAFRSHVLLIGDWVYFIAQTNKWPKNYPEENKWAPDAPNYRMRIFYRIPKSDLLDPNKSTVYFEKQKITYQDCEGNWHYNSDIVDPVPYVFGKDSSGNKIVKSLWFDWEVSFERIYLSPYPCQWVYKEDPSNKNKANLKMLHGVLFFYYGVRTTGINHHYAMPFTFDTTTNTLTLDPRWFKIKYNVETDVRTPPQGKNINEWYSWNIAGYLQSGHDDPGCSWVDGIGYCKIGSSIRALPYQFTGFYAGNKTQKDKTQWELFNSDFSSYGNEWVRRTFFMDSPFGFATLPATLTDSWYYNNQLQQTPIEIFHSLDGNGRERVYYRITESPEYAERDVFKFKYIPKTIIGRKSNGKFGQVFLKGKSGNEANWLPVIHGIPDKTKSREYGIFRFGNGRNALPLGKKYPYFSSPLYNLLNFNISWNSTDDTEGGFYLDTLGTHTLDANNKKLIIDSDLSGRVWITKQFWYNILSTLIPADKLSKITDENGYIGNGEYAICVYLNSVEGNNTHSSLAMCYYHTFEEPEKCYTSSMVFKWGSSGLHEGYRVPSIVNKHALYSDTPISNVDRRANNSWSYQTFDYEFPGVVPTLQVNREQTDNSKMDFWFSSGIQLGTVGAAATPYWKGQSNGALAVGTPSMSGMYVASVISNLYQYADNIGLLRAVNGLASGGAAYYLDNGDKYCLMQAVFIEGNWTLFVNTDMNVYFNGTVKKLPKTNYDLSELGIDPKNKTFYLYAVSGKVEGYYELTLAERTTSPYQIQVAIIKTNAFGIETIDVDQSFEVSGFKLSTQRQGGIIPATLGPAPQNTPSLKAIKKEDLFDKTKY